MKKIVSLLDAFLYYYIMRIIKKNNWVSLILKNNFIGSVIIRVEISPIQAQCCEAIIARNYEALAKQSGGKKSSLQNICMELKKVCNHPLLVGRRVEASAVVVDVI